MRRLNGAEFPSFIAATSVAVIHFDAEWNVQGRPLVRRTMLDAERVLGDRVNFAEVDVDKHAELAKSLHLANVPTVAYYRDGRLVAALVGANQNVLARIQRVMARESIGYRDGTSMT